MPTNSGTTMTAKKRIETAEKKGKEIEAKARELEEAIAFSKSMSVEDYMDPEYLDNEQEQPGEMDMMEQKDLKDFFITLWDTEDGTTRKASTLERLRKLEGFVENLDQKIDELFEYLYNPQPEYMDIPEEVWEV